MNEKIKQMINSLRSKMEKVLTHMTARNTGRAKISSLIIIGICLTLILTMTVGAAAVMRSTSPTPDTVVDVTEEVTESTMTTEKSEATPAEKEETVPEETEGTEATEATEVTEATEETKPTEESKEKTQRPTDGNSSDSGVYNTWDTCVGTFSVPGVGLSVNCYASASQETVDAKNSAAYFYSQGHSIIGDHVNQGFNKIKSCHEGTTAYLAGVEYECVAVMSGHNDGSRLTTSNGTDIRDMYPALWLLIPVMAIGRMLLWCSLRSQEPILKTLIPVWVNLLTSILAKMVELPVRQVLINGTLWILGLI